MLTNKQEIEHKIMKKVTRKLNKFGVRKYEQIESEASPFTFYTVGKVRKLNSRNYKYVCTCPHFFYRQKTCKHILKFKELEKAI